MFSIVALCRDWHPKNHISFVSQHQDMQEFDSILLSDTGQE